MRTKYSNNTNKDEFNYRLLVIFVYASESQMI